MYQKPRLTPAVKGILIAIAAVYLVQLSLSQFARIPMVDLFGFSPRTFFFHGWLWQVLTYPFLHGPLGHIVFNGLALYLLGSDLEGRWGQKRFLTFFGICAMGGALLQSIVWALSYVFAPSMSDNLGSIPIIGASGALYGLFVAFGRIYGDAQIYVMFLFPMKAKHFVTLLVAMELVSAVFFNNGGVAHLVHLGGLATGWLLLKFKGNNLDGRGGFSFRRKKTMDREEVRRRLNIVVNRDDEKGGKYPITWN